MTVKAPVTVVVPAFNAERFIGVTIEAIRGQTTPPERIIVVDDGSVDGTVGVANTYGVEVVTETRRGAGAARNIAVEMAATKYVAFCNANDYFVPDKLERDLEQLQSLGAMCLASDAWIVKDDRVEGRKNVARVVPNVLTEEFLIRGNPIISSTVVALRTAVLDAGGFDESPELAVTADYDLWLRMAARDPIAYSHKPMTFFRVLGDSLSSAEQLVDGVDATLQRVLERRPSDPHFAELVRRRRATFRLERASSLMRGARYEEAAELIRAAQRMRWTWTGCRLALRAWLKR